MPTFPAIPPKTGNTLATLPLTVKLPEQPVFRIPEKLRKIDPEGSESLEQEMDKFFRNTLEFLQSDRVDAITPLRRLSNTASELLDTAKSESATREAAISAESASRQSAIALLNTAITSEITARQQAVSTEAALRAEAIAAEATARTNAIAGEASRLSRYTADISLASEASKLISIPISGWTAVPDYVLVTVARKTGATTLHKQVGAAYLKTDSSSANLVIDVFAFDGAVKSGEVTINVFALRS